MPHYLLDLLPVLGFVAVDLTVLTCWFRVLGAIFPPQRGVAESVMAFLAKNYIVFIGLCPVFVFGVAVYLDKLPENLYVLIDL